MNSKDFGKRVADLRKGKRLTQSELAEKLNISNKAVSRWETGEGYPEITILPTLAKELGVTIDELLKDPIEDFNDTKFENVNAFEHKKVKEVPLKKPYWNSLIIFNKIGVASLIIILISLLLYGTMLFTGFLFNGVPSFLFFIPVFTYGIATIIGKAGLVATIIGLIAGLLNLYDRQIKGSVLIALVLFVATYILPLIMVSTSMFVV